MLDSNLETLERFIVRAKQSAYVGSGQRLLSYRLGSKDFQFVDGGWSHNDEVLYELLYHGGVLRS